MLVAGQVVDTLALARKAVKHLLRTKWTETDVPGHGVVGIDTEWQPGTQNPTAVLQAGTLDAVFLFDLPALHGRYPDKVRARQLAHAVPAPIGTRGRRQLTTCVRVMLLCNQWPVLARRLLMARNVVKTAYGLDGDLARLARWVRVCATPTSTWWCRVAR